MITYTRFTHSQDNIISIKSYYFELNGSGLDDLSFVGELSNELAIIIKIDSVGEIDTFKISMNGGATWNQTLVPITGLYQFLVGSISILFANITGHTLNDEWSIAGDISSYPLSWFQTEVPTYSLPLSPDGVVAQDYVPNKYYRIFTPESLVYGGTIFADGDTYIANKITYDVNYAVYLSTPKTVEEAKAIKVSQLESKEKSIIDGMVSFFTVSSGVQIFLSDIDTYNQLFDQCYLFTKEGVVPSGYSFANATAELVELTLVELQELVALIQSLYYASNVNYSLHFNAIMSLTTIQDIQDYDITTGWAIVPYTG